MNRSYPIDPSRYPATSRLLEQAELNPATAEDPHFSMVVAGVSRVVAAASLAMSEGDQKTVCSMAEVLSRIALGPFDPSDPTMKPFRESLTYQVWAILDIAYARPAFEPDTVAKFKARLPKSSAADELRATKDLLRMFKSDGASTKGVHS